MGILNITPDSFYDGGEYLETKQVQDSLSSLMNSDIIDIGAESSRPYSDPVSIEDELSRLSIIESIDFNNKTLSIDSYKYKIIQNCLENGFGMINDISGGGEDFKNIDLACEYDVPIVLMHMKGHPKTMQDNPKYDNIIDEIKSFFDKRLNYAINIGMNENNIIIDPGIGFGKTIKDNDKIILNLSKFKDIGCPILIGVSRKSFLSVDNNSPKDRLYSSLGVTSLCVFNGADIVRVHDVNETKNMLSIIDRMKN